MESEITNAVILMAGSGSRLRASGEKLPKPLIPICGRPLVSYLIAALEKSGVTNLHIVVGVHGRDLASKISPLLPSSMRLNEILNPESHKQNGLSVLCAGEHVTEPFLLLMGDHLFEFPLPRKADRTQRAWIPEPGGRSQAHDDLRSRRCDESANPRRVGLCDRQKPRQLRRDRHRGFSLP
jgi:choline kinase